MKVTKQGFEVSQFNGVIRIYLRRSLVAMVTNFGTKIAITRLTKEIRVGILAPNRVFLRSVP